jgi:hypothetical protein
LIISPTSSGDALFDQIRDDRRAFFRNVLADIGIGERAVIESAIERMALSLRA